MSTPPPPGGGWTPPPSSGGPSWPPPGGPSGPSTPPPFPPPGGPGTPPPFGLPGPPPPPRRSTSGALIALLVGGGLVAVLLIAAAFVVLLGDGDDASPQERLREAADKLSSAQALELEGSFGSSLDSGRVKVLRSGHITGELRVDGQTRPLVKVDDDVFVKADKSFWQRKLGFVNLEKFQVDGERWGRIESSSLELDFQRYATPSALAASLRSFTSIGIRSDLEVTRNGRRVTKIVTSRGTYYLSKDNQLVRIELTVPHLHADVTAHSSSVTTVNELRVRVNELKNSLDVTRSARISEVKGCENESASGCTVRVQVTVSRAPTGSKTLVNVYIWITEETKTGRKLGDCTTTATVIGLSSTWTECRVSTPEWTSFYRTSEKRRIHWWMQAEPMAVAVDDSDISRMLSAISRG